MAIDQVGNPAPVSQPAESAPATSSQPTTGGGGTVDWAAVASAMLGSNATEQTKAAIQGLGEEGQRAKENRQAERLIVEDEKKKTNRSTKAFTDRKLNEEKERVEVDRGGKELKELSDGKTKKPGEAAKTNQTKAASAQGNSVANLLNPKSWGSPFTSKPSASPETSLPPKPPEPNPQGANPNPAFSTKTKPFFSNPSQRLPAPASPANPAGNPLPAQPQKPANPQLASRAASPNGEGDMELPEVPQTLEPASLPASTASNLTAQGARTMAKGNKSMAKLAGEDEAPSELSSHAPQASEEKSLEGSLASADTNASLIDKKNKERLERSKEHDTVERVTRDAGSAGHLEVPEDERASWKEMRERSLQGSDGVSSATPEASQGVETDSFDPELYEQSVNLEKTKLRRQIYAASINGDTGEIDALMRDYAAAHDQVKANRAPGGLPVSTTSKSRGKSNVSGADALQDPSVGGIKDQLAQLNQNIERLVTGVVESNRMREEGTVDAIRDLKYAMTRTKPFNPVEQRPVSQTYTANLYETRFQKTDPLRSAYQDVASGKADARQAASLNPLQEQADALGYKPDAIKKNKNPGRSNLA